MGRTRHKTEKSGVSNNAPASKGTRTGNRRGEAASEEDPSNRQPTTNPPPDSTNVSHDGSQEDVRLGAISVGGVNAPIDQKWTHSHEFGASEELESVKQPSRGNLQAAMLIDEETIQRDEMENNKIKEQAQLDVQARMMAVAVKAEQTDLAEEQALRELRRCRRTVLLVALLALLVVGVVVGVFVATDDSSEDPAPSQEPTMVPTVAATKPAGPGVGVPQGPPEHSCEDAYNATKFIGGSYIGEITSDAPIALVDTCETIVRNGAGTWFYLEGSGSTLVASTCEGTAFDSQVSVYTGSCGKLQCVAGNDQASVCGNGDQSMVAFLAESNVIYYVYVHGSRSATGQFNLTLEHRDQNDDCGSATELELGRNTFGTTRGATIQNVSCGVMAPDYPGIWYSFRGRDNGDDGDDYVRVRVTPLDGQAWGGSIVLRGECGELQCVRDSPWTAEAGVQYYIFVYVSEKVGGDLVVGIEFGYSPGGFYPDFECGVSLVNQLSVGRPQFRWTDDQYTRDAVSCGNLVFSTTSGAFFGVIGTGNKMTVSTCDDASTFDTQLSVFRGACDSLECVDGNDQACGDQSTVSWVSEWRTVYYVLVHGFGDRTGQFNLTLHEEKLPDSSDFHQCTQAITISPDAAGMIGTLYGVNETDKVEQFPVCDNLALSDIVPGMWYKVAGDGSNLTASTCLRSSNTVSSISVFEGSCKALTCIAGEAIRCGLQTSFVWQADSGVEYFLFVQAIADPRGGDGSFVLQLAETTSNDHCQNAIGPLAPDNSLTFGSTRDATTEVAIGNGGEASRGVWYKFIGTGNVVLSSTCSIHTNFITQLNVLRGSCGTLEKVERLWSFTKCAYYGTDFQWNSTAEEVYYILVSGTSVNEYGNFALSLTEV